MRILAKLPKLAAVLALTFTAPLAAAEPMTLWYDKPASKWTEALAVGNGRLGAMVFGKTHAERLQFNEDTLWTGEPHDYAHDGAVKYLPTVRKLLFEGKRRDAERLAMEHMMSVPLRLPMYQPFGDVHLEFPGHEKVDNYLRDLDIDSGIASVRYRVGDATFRREVFAGAPDQAIVVRITCDKPGKLTFKATISSPHPSAACVVAGTDKKQLALRGQLREKLNRRLGKKMPSVLKFEARLLARAEGGTLSVTDAGAEFQGADAATLILVAATSFKTYRDVTADPKARCEQAIAALADKPFAKLRDAHVADHRRLFRRVEIDLSATDAATEPTDRRIKAFATRPDPQLVALYFQFGRYLLMASSRPGSQPANLQGIWNESLSPPWGSKWTTNINTEMNYWAAELANLSECHEPLFDLIEGLAVTGQSVAKKHYGCRGWVFHHNADLWRSAAPVNNSNHGIWVTGGAWLTRHMWERYLFTGDKQFLAQRAYPVLKQAAVFFLDFLVKDPKTGRLISTPSNSPEQGGLVAGPTMDHQIIRELFGHCIEAAKVLGVDADFREKLIATRKQIAPNQIGQHGQLQEWLTDVDNPGNRHRHVSHMYALHPGHEITPRGTPKLAKACRTTLTHRGDGGTGWSMAWKINLWARLHDAEHTFKLITNIISRGTLPNMFDNHPPFQIDGNFGGCAGIAQMLLQTHAGEIELLPAVPKALATGKVRGLCARGGLEVDLKWTAGRAVEAVLRAKLAGQHRLRPPAGQKIVKVLEGEKEVPTKSDGDVRILTVRAGATYRVVME